MSGEQEYMQLLPPLIMCYANEVEHFLVPIDAAELPRINEHSFPMQAEPFHEVRTLHIRRAELLQIDTSGLHVEFLRDVAIHPERIVAHARCRC